MCMYIYVYVYIYMYTASPRGIRYNTGVNTLKTIITVLSIYGFIGRYNI